MQMITNDSERGVGSSKKQKQKQKLAVYVHMRSACDKSWEEEDQEHMQPCFPFSDPKGPQFWPFGPVIRTGRRQFQGFDHHYVTAARSEEGRHGLISWPTYLHPPPPSTFRVQTTTSAASVYGVQSAHSARLHVFDGDSRHPQYTPMDESPEPSQNDDPSTPAPLPDVIAVATKGDLVLDVTFETSTSTLKATRKAAPTPRPGQPSGANPAQILKPRIRLAYRVDLATLKKHSRYFTNLLGDIRFQEARDVAASLSALSLRGEKPAEVTDPAELPRVRIVDDDDATRSVGREKAFGDMLRILHGRDATTKPVTLLYIVTLAVMADRFACTAPVARYLSTGLKFKWPATPPPRLREDGLSGLSLAAEEVVRQKILISWLLDQPMRFASSTRDVIIHGSHRWSTQDEIENEDYGALDPARDAANARQEALWWYLPDGLEGKCPLPIPHSPLVCSAS